MPPKLSTEIINAAILGFEEQKRRIDAEIANLRAMLSGAPAQTAAAPASAEIAAPSRKLSAAERRKIAAAQRRRWAAVKGAAARKRQIPEILLGSLPIAQHQTVRTRSAPVATPKKAKRKLSAAGKAAIAAATKKRWASFRAAKVAEKE
jgi:hypothetical protein